MKVLLDILFAFAFLYPLLMAWTWMVGGLWFFFKGNIMSSNCLSHQVKGAVLLFLALMKKLRSDKRFVMPYRQNIRILKSLL